MNFSDCVSSVFTARAWQVAVAEGDVVSTYRGVQLKSHKFEVLTRPIRHGLGNLL